MKYLIMIIVVLFLAGCGGERNKEKADNNNSAAENNQAGSETGREGEDGKMEKGNHSHSAHLNDKGIGPIKEVKLGDIDTRLAGKGKEVFQSKCVVCHELDNRKVGPPLRDVTDRLSPEFIMNYLLNTEEMQQKNEHLRALVKEYNTIMPDQDLSESDARAILEYLREQNAR